MGTPHDLARSGIRTVSAHRPSTASNDSSIVKLRRYRLHPGARERLIDLFDRQFVETQETVGMAVIGQFRDLDDADSFVWLRGFRDMPSRAEALGAFYGGPVWARHREAANRTMINSDNVLLLRPARHGSGFALPEGRPDVHARDLPPGLVIATICHLAPRTEEAFADFFAAVLAPQLVATSAKILASFVTERSPNTFRGFPSGRARRSSRGFAASRVWRRTRSILRRLRAARRGPRMPYPRWIDESGAATKSCGSRRPHGPSCAPDDRKAVDDPYRSGARRGVRRLCGPVLASDVRGVTRMPGGILSGCRR
jgi:hypothetical protein